MSTECGIPWIELQGTEQDWMSLRERAAKLGLLMMPSFATKWMEVLLPVLDQFVSAYQGSVDHEFWQSMVKRVQHGRGSGSYETVSGWINVFYPYLTDGSNPFLMPWKTLIQSDGPQPDDFPRIISSAPVEWDYHGTLIKLQVHAGMLGTVQDEDTLALRPRVSWAVTHDPPKDPATRIKQLETELVAIRACGDDDYKTRSWIRRGEKELQAMKSGGKPLPKDLYY